MLELRFSTFAGRALLSCDAGSTNHLQRLRSHYSTGRSISNQAFDLEVDDLLVNLNELAAWPSEDTDIRWQPELLSLVEGNAADAAIVQSRLAIPTSQTPAAVAPLSDEWLRQLTDFQRRDIAKLQELAHGANFSVPGAGKTRVALAIFDARRRSGEVTRMLVVCPKSAFESWQVEAASCFAKAPIHVAIMDGATAPAADVVLINYERLPDASRTFAMAPQSASASGS